MVRRCFYVVAASSGTSMAGVWGVPRVAAATSFVGRATAAPSRRRALCATWQCPLWYCACLAHAHGALRPGAVHARTPCLDQAQHAWKGKSAEIFVLPHSGHVQRDVTDAMGALVAALARVLSFERGGRVVSGSFGEHAMGGATLLGMILGRRRQSSRASSATIPLPRCPGKQSLKPRGHCLSSSSMRGHRAWRLGGTKQREHNDEVSGHSYDSRRRADARYCYGAPYPCIDAPRLMALEQVSDRS